jgi:hypothetical protein
MGYYADVGEEGRGGGGRNINHLIFIMSKEISASQAEEESNKFKIVQYTERASLYLKELKKPKRIEERNARSSVTFYIYV